MATLLIAYDLKRPGQEYTDLIERIKRFGKWWHCLESTWLIAAEMDPGQVGDALRPLVDVNDALMILDVSDVSWATFGPGQECTDWLNDNVAPRVPL